MATAAVLGAAPPATAAIPTHLDSAPATDRSSDLLDACPIAGDDLDLHDSWGWARSGGRRHQGIDVAAPRGTELFAVRSGTVDFKQSNLGGNSVWLVTDDGDRFFYAHLDGFEGDDRVVDAGELIGYVGSTGNAGGSHLHFETHPDGVVENPFEHVVEACTTPPDPSPAAVRDLLARLGRTSAMTPTSTARLHSAPGSVVPF